MQVACYFEMRFEDLFITRRLFATMKRIIFGIKGCLALGVIAIFVTVYGALSWGKKDFLLHIKQA